MTNLTKRLTLYIVGLFFLSLAVSFSIYASLGVSPGSSLSYAFALTTGLSVGTTTILLNILYIVIQMVIKKRFDLRDAITQMIIAFAFGFFIDTTLLFLRTFLPTPDAFLLKVVYLMISLVLIGGGLFVNVSAQFTLMPYDQMTKVISTTLNKPFSQVKVKADMIIVTIAGLICLIFLRSFGSIGVGTVISALSIGTIMGWFHNRYHSSIEKWMTPIPTNKEIIYSKK